ncbi:hypothetical protein JTE90_010204 [Oedothorax gibbosus]|uniref:BRISC and BRCA1-A complex member 2 n=1 Tax=Oedothorax gibbosus TaxID=931172 RepID=A0AAV6UIF4_9ARAC|nr:hypothetical protein JTE90_010204 [Oedothorax gibbosus]
MSLTWFAPHVLKQLEEVIKTGKIGICPGPIKILNPMPSGASWQPKNYCDRFKLVIPYGGHTVDWDVILQASSPECPPDFIFTTCPNFVSFDQIKTILDWDPEKPDSLLTILRELIRHYQKYQASRLEKYSRVQFEYSTLTQQTDVTDDDVEVHVTDEKEGPINFLIRLGTQFNGIPKIYKNDNGDTALLLVTFNSLEGTKITPKLCLPPKIEHALGSPLSWRIPAFSSDGCLMDYVPFVQESLKKRVEMVAYNFEKRMEYLFVFLDHFEGAYLEFDRDLASKATFLFEQNGFFFIFHIDVPQNFPMGKPSFTFRSIYHSTFEKPYSTTVMNYPYNQGWSAKMMLEHAVEFIQQYVDVFQHNSVQNGVSALTAIA